MQGIADERTCQVRRGGVQPEEVDFSTLEASSCPGFFVLGEALDVDGPAGDTTFIGRGRLVYWRGVRLRTLHKVKGLLILQSLRCVLGIK